MAKILIEEDSKVNREAARQQLKDMGHELVFVKSFTEFFNSVKNPLSEKIEDKLNLNSFDMVLADLNLTTLHGTGGESKRATGWIAMLKAMTEGVKKVAILTDESLWDDKVGYAMWPCVGMSTIGDVKVYVGFDRKGVLRSDLTKSMQTQAAEDGIWTITLEDGTKVKDPDMKLNSISVKDWKSVVNKLLAT